MATPLGITFSTDEQVVAQGNVTFMGKTIESLIVEFSQAKYEFLYSGFKSPRVTRNTAGSPQRSAPKSLRRLLQRWLAQTEPFLVASRVWPASPSPTRPTSLKANFITPLLSTFLSSRLPGVSNNP